MSWLSKLSSLSLLVFMCLTAEVVIAQDKSDKPDKSLEKSLVGEWVVVTCSRAGVADKSMVGASFTIDDAGKSHLGMLKSPPKTARFDAQLHDEKSKLFRVLIETDEDSVGLGGSGPRKGICQMNDKGELQVFEALTTSLDYPKDFSKDSTSTSKGLVWILSRKPKSK
jgi:hypothetical protein